MKTKGRNETPFFVFTIALDPLNNLMISRKYLAH